jgi:hypothetical protein
MFNKLELLALLEKTLISLRAVSSGFVEFWFIISITGPSQATEDIAPHGCQLC